MHQEVHETIRRLGIQPTWEIRLLPCNQSYISRLCFRQVFQFLTFNTERILNNTVRNFTSRKRLFAIFCLCLTLCASFPFYISVLCKAKSIDDYAKILYLQDPPQIRIKHFPWKTKLASLREELRGPKQRHRPIPKLISCWERMGSVRSHTQPSSADWVRGTSLHPCVCTWAQSLSCVPSL